MSISFLSCSNLRVIGHRHLQRHWQCAFAHFKHWREMQELRKHWRNFEGSLLTWSDHQASTHTQRERERERENERCACRDKSMLSHTRPHIYAHTEMHARTLTTDKDSTQDCGEERRRDTSRHASPQAVCTGRSYKTILLVLGGEGRDNLFRTIKA